MEGNNKDCTGSHVRPKSIKCDDLVETDLLVIGSGLGGLWSALSARDNGVENVVVVDKGAIADSSQSKMCAGATIYCGPRDNADLWLGELVRQQGYLSRQDMVIDMLSTSYARLLRLKSWGLWYKRTPWGSTTLPVGGARHLRMNAMARFKDLGGGSALVAPIKEQVKAGDVRFYSKIMITSLLKNKGRIAGAMGVHRITGKTVGFKAGCIVLATADCGFRNSACIGQATGDGFLLAYDAGARLNNMEFLGSNTGSPQYSLEAFADLAAGYGCKFLNAGKETFMGRYAASADRAEPFRIAQTMADEMEKGNAPPFYLDMTGLRWRLFLKFLYKRNATGFLLRMFEALEEHGVDPTGRPQEWGPLIRTIRGGVRTNMDCMSDSPGLFAAGTAQSVDPAGLNGYSTMRVMWSGERAGRAAAGFLNDIGDTEIDREDLDQKRRDALLPMKRKSGVHPDTVIGRLQNVILPYWVSLRKTEASLRSALAEVESIRYNCLPDLYAHDPHQLVKAHEARNMVLAAEFYLRASLKRNETRGDHYRADFPKTDNKKWLKWINIEKGEAGRPLLSTEEVPLQRYGLQPELKTR